MLGCTIVCRCRQGRRGGTVFIQGKKTREMDIRKMKYAIKSNASSNVT
jgi:hypothetical protein